MLKQKAAGYFFFVKDWPEAETWFYSHVRKKKASEKSLQKDERKVRMERDMCLSKIGLKQK